MNQARTAVISCVISGAITCTGLWWPRSVRPGWFELEGRPRAVDGLPVEDWQHVNELLAKFAVAACPELQRSHAANQSGGQPLAAVEREFRFDYVPADSDGSLQRVVVRQSVPSRVLWADRHPVWYATYEIVTADRPVPR